MRSGVRPSSSVRAAARNRSPWQLAASFGVGYFTLNEVGLRMALPPTDFAVFWPAAGLALAVFLLAPYRLWPALAVAQGAANFVGNVAHGNSAWLSVWFVVANLAESMVGAAAAIEWRRLVRRSSRTAEFLVRPLFCGVLNAMLAAAIATLAIRFVADADADLFLTWRTWWIADAMGILTVAPVLLFARSDLDNRAVRARAVEGMAAALVAWSVAALLFSERDGADLTPSVVYVLLPILLWPALRLGRAVTAGIFAGTVMISVWLTSRGLGPFVGPADASARHALDAQLFLGALGCTVLTVTIAIDLMRAAERAHAVRAAERAERELLEELYARTSSLAAERESLLDRATLLAEVSTVLDEALSVDSQLDRLARLLSERLGVWCGIDLIVAEPEGPVLEPHTQSGAVVLTTRRRAAPASMPFTEVFAGRPVLLPIVPTESLRARVDDDRFEELSRLGLRSVMLAPITTGGTVYGVINLVSIGDGRAFDDADLDLVFDVGRRAGQTVRNAQLFQRQREIATSLQASLLPDSLPNWTGFEVAARYLPGEEGLDVGGDWYDAFTGADGLLRVVVGDIVGGGLEAASATGQLRSGVRALASRCDGPADLLAELDTFAGGVKGAEVATLAYVELDPATGEFRYACAGHPPPLVVDDEGNHRFLEAGRSAPLVTVRHPPRPEGEDHLAEGETLLLFTDGLFERRGELLDTGLDRIVESARRHRAAPTLDAFCDGMLPDLVDPGGPSDDVCLVAVTRPLLDPDRFRRVFAAEPGRLAEVRRAMRVWLHGREIDGALVDDLLLATFEAAANAVEHAYVERTRGVVTVDARIDAGELVVEVIDQGTWRSPSAPGDRGRGTGLMNAVMDGVTLRRSPTGTSVELRKSLPGG